MEPHPESSAPEERTEAAGDGAPAPSELPSADKAASSSSELPPAHTPVRSDSTQAPVVTTAPPTISPLSRSLAALSAFIPGVGHVILERYFKGILYFVLFLTAINTVFLTTVLDIEGRWRTPILGLAGLAIALWLTAFVDLIITLVNCRAQSPEERNARFVAAVGHFLRDEHQEAKELLVRLLQRNPSDAAVCLQLAAVYEKLGEPQKARKVLKRCHKLDRERVWEYQIVSRLRALEGH